MLLPCHWFFENLFGLSHQLTADICSFRPYWFLIFQHVIFSLKYDRIDKIEIYLSPDIKFCRFYLFLQ